MLALCENMKREDPEMCKKMISNTNISPLDEIKEGS